MKYLILIREQHIRLVERGENWLSEFVKGKEVITEMRILQNYLIMKITQFHVIREKLVGKRVKHYGIKQQR